MQSLRVNDFRSKSILRPDVETQKQERGSTEGQVTRSTGRPTRCDDTSTKATRKQAVR